MQNVSCINVGLFLLFFLQFVVGCHEVVARIALLKLGFTMMALYFDA